jgi:hypothetical protein
MLFQISWNLPSQNRVPCWNVFGKMTPVDDLKDTGDNIKVHGRWHVLGGSGGICICECDSAEELNTWMLNWSPLCDITVVPVVDDASARRSLQGKPFMQNDIAGETKVAGASA